MRLKFRSAITKSLVLTNLEYYDIVLDTDTENFILKLYEVSSTSTAWTIMITKDFKKAEQVIEIIEEAIENDEKMLDLTQYSIMDE